MKPEVMIIDDEEIQRVTIVDALEDAGYPVISFTGAMEAIQSFKEKPVDLVITDHKMPGMDGEALLKEIKNVSPETIVVMITAYGSVDDAVQVMKEGAYDYITKPFNMEEFLLKINRISDYISKTRELRELHNALDQDKNRIIGSSPKMKKIFTLIKNAAQTDSTIMIQGESGTGKELIAEAIHRASARRTKPLIKVNCAVFSENLLESELFGHEKGAFTGAIRQRFGRFERADGGTLFMDDIDDIPLPVQVKLLRAIQEGEFERVGGNETIKVDDRLICATKINLWDKVQEGTFREDLYYRLNVIPILLPPLRERREDIPLLLEHFLRRFGKRMNKPGIRIEPDAIERLVHHTWQGNIRELENTIERMVAMTFNNTIKLKDIPPDIIRKTNDNKSLSSTGFIPDEKRGLEDTVLEYEKNIILKVMEEANNNKTRAAEILHIPRSTLNYKLSKIHRPTITL